ncbi:cell wall hydrolase [Lachnospiraceae bacterium YH-ros2228]
MNKHCKKNKRIQVMSLLLSISLTGGVFFTPLYSQAKSKSSVAEERRQELLKKQKDAESKKAEANENLNKLMNEKQDLEKNKTSITDQISSVRGQIQSAQDKVAETGQDIQKLSEDLTEAENKENELHDKIKEQIAISYENETGKNVLVYILESGSLAEFLNRMEYASSISAYNKSLLESYSKLKDAIASKSSELEKQKEEAENAKETLAKKQEELGNLLSSTNQEIDSKAEEAGLASANLDEIDRQIKEYKAEVQKIEQDTAKAQANQVNAALAEQKKEKDAAEANLEAQENALKQKQDEQARLDQITKQKEAERIAAEQAANEAEVAAKKAAEEQARAEAEANRRELEEQKSKTEEARSQVENISKVASSAGRVYNAGAQEVKLLGAICQAEAGNQGYNGMLAVASVIMNRVYIKKYGFASQNSITSVVYAKNQFEPVRKTRGVTSKKDYVGETELEYYLYHYDTEVSSNAKNAAAAALRGSRYTTGSGPMNQLFFMTPKAYSQQAWFSKSKVRDYFQLGGHVFFNVNV